MYNNIEPIVLNTKIEQLPQFIILLLVSQRHVKTCLQVIKLILGTQVFAGHCKGLLELDCCISLAHYRHFYSCVLLYLMLFYII